MQVAIADAKAQFAELIRRAEAGEQVVITRHGRPVAELHPAAPGPRLPLFGALKGQIAIAEDFDALPEAFTRGLSASVEPE